VSFAKATPAFCHSARSRRIYKRQSIIFYRLCDFTQSDSKKIQRGGFLEPPPIKEALMFIGFGYDVHRFKKGRKLILGGVEIKHPKGLDGHSDADVLLHALMDALLGAAGLCDIGHFFPNTDPKYKGASSLKLLEVVYKQLKKRSFKINNADITIIAETPKIYPFIDEIKENISKTINLKKERIAVKATTNEKMGFIGRSEGIAAMAVVSLKPMKN